MLALFSKFYAKLFGMKQPPIPPGETELDYLPKDYIIKKKQLDDLDIYQKTFTKKNKYEVHKN